MNKYIVNPLISIVMPVYNASRYLNECIDSVLSQSFTDFEFIIVDDGSTDSSIKIIESYKDPRIVLIKNEHDFIDSLNIGMTRAKGKFIARMDADDIMMSTRLDIQYSYMENHPNIDVCGGWMDTFGDNQHSIKQSLSHQEILLNAILYCPLAHPTVIMHSSIKKNFIYKNGIYNIYDKNYIYAEDYKLWTVLLSKGYRFANIPEILLRYRVSNTQVTSVKQQEMLKTTYRIQNEYIQTLMDEIICIDNQHFEILNNGIELRNINKLNYSSFRNIVQDIASNISTKLFVKK